MRLFLLALMAVAAVSGQSPKKICEPGEITRKPCYWCTCGPDGYSQGCSPQPCAENNFKVPKYRRELASEDHQSGLTAPLLRQIREVNSRLPCEPGKQFKRYCNTCSCAADGLGVACTRMECPEGIFNEDGSRRNARSVEDVLLTRETRQVSHNRPCEAGKSFKSYCNTCTCGADGISVACTRMECPEGVFNEDGSRRNLEPVEDSALTRETRQVSHNRPCEAGKKFKSYCNTCTCGADGFSVACTRMHCPEGMFNEDGSRRNAEPVEDSTLTRETRQVNHNRPCEAGKSFKSYCNTCTCGADGISVACTRMECPEGVFNEDGSRRNARSVEDILLTRETRQVSHNRPCEAGKSFKIYCNTCTCGSDGFSVACTRKGCPEGKFNEDGTLREPAPIRETRQVKRNRRCEAGKSYKNYCNICTCASNGFTLTCTHNTCPEGKFNKDGTLRDPAPTRETRQVNHNRPCEPGTRIKNYCNTCTCGADGVSRACTRMHCPEGRFNEDGSLRIPESA